MISITLNQSLTEEDLESKDFYSFIVVATHPINGIGETAVLISLPRKICEGTLITQDIINATTFATETQDIFNTTTFTTESQDIFNTTTFTTEAQNIFNTTTFTTESQDMFNTTAYATETDYLTEKTNENFWNVTTEGHCT